MNPSTSRFLAGLVVLTIVLANSGRAAAQQTNVELRGFEARQAWIHMRQSHVRPIRGKRDVLAGVGNRRSGLATAAGTVGASNS
jgi:hypothetical protein